MKRVSMKTPPKNELPVRKKRGALMVYEKLREDIQWMRIEPGSALDEVELAKNHEVSRTPIREALLLLANEGFVKFLQNRTSIVAPLSLHNQAAFLDTFILLSRGLVRAASMHGAADREQLEGLVNDFALGLKADNIEKAFRAQLALYHQIAALAKNRFLTKYFLEAQDASVRMKLLYFFPHLTEADRNEAEMRLRAVVDALVAENPDGGDTAVRDAILFENRVIKAGLEPRYGHRMALDQGNDL